MTSSTRGKAMRCGGSVTARWTASGRRSRPSRAFPTAPKSNTFGMAHGWAGLDVLQHSAGVPLRKPLHRPVPSPVWRSSLACAELLGTGLSVETVRASGSPAYMAGWCKRHRGGSCTSLRSPHRTLGDDRWLTLAERAAWHSWEAGGSVSSLCCGYTGQAYALLNLHRHNGDPAWLQRARELTARAALASSDGEPEGRDDSLYKGRVGVALLAADIEVPELARMPFVEPEGWPVVPARMS